MDLKQVGILIIAGMLFIPFLCGLIEELIKEHVEKNKAIRKQNMELRKAYRRMLEEKRYAEFKRINKMQFLSCTIK